MVISTRTRVWAENTNQGASKFKIQLQHKEILKPSKQLKLKVRKVPKQNLIQEMKGVGVGHGAKITKAGK